MTSRALVARQPRTLRHADSLEIRSLRTPCGEDTRAPIARGLVPPRAPDPKPRMPIRAPPHRTHTRAPHLLEVASVSSSLGRPQCARWVYDLCTNPGRNCSFPGPYEYIPTCLISRTRCRRTAGPAAVYRHRPDPSLGGSEAMSVASGSRKCHVKLPLATRFWMVRADP